MKNYKAFGLAMVALGIAFLAIGMNAQKTFFGIAAVFFILGIISLAKSRRA